MALLQDKYMKNTLHGSGVYCLFLLIIFSCFPCLQALAADWQSQAMVKPREGAMPLLPFMDYYIDQSCSMDIEEVSSSSFSTEFKTLVLDDLPRVEGVTWLRFTIAPLPPEARPGTFLLDMGQSVPGTPILYDPERNELSGTFEWQEKTPAQRNILLLPEEGSQAITCYIKIDGIPGPWFAPMIRTPQNAASNLSSLAYNAAVLALGVVLVICLLRGLGERGQWRFWTAFFVAVALAQAILGMPQASDKFSFSTLASVLAPGIALMLLPHVGRHLLQTPRYSRNLDIQLLLLSLPGAAIALWPLLPGWAWLERWVNVWPICTLIFVPTALGAWIMGLAGAKRFLAACLIPPLFTGASLAGLDFGFPANLLASGPIWGVSLCALLIAATKSPDNQASANTAQKASAQTSVKSIPASDETIISLDHPLDDPNLRLLPSQETETQLEQEKIPAAFLDYNSDTPEKAQSLEDRETALREPLDEIMRQGAALGQCSLPPAVRQYAESMIGAANTLAAIMSGQQREPNSSGEASTYSPDKPFSLQKLLRNVHDSVAAFAESAGTALSWYVPPNMGRLYLGNEEELENMLRLLLESSVRASRNGSVHISARRVPGSDDPGHILFSITDNGSGVPPRDRSSLAISRAWELAGRHDGYLAMEVGPDGSDIALSLHFPVEEEEEQVQKSGNHVVLASDNASRRRELARTIEELPCRLTQVGSAQEVLVCQSIDPAGLLVAHGQLARPSAADTIHKFADLAREAGFEQTYVLAITEDDKQWHLLKPSGFTHAMLEPDNLETLKETINGLLQSLKKNETGSDNQKNSAKGQQADAAKKTGLISDQKISGHSDDQAPDLSAFKDGDVIQPTVDLPNYTPSTSVASSGVAEDEGQAFEGPDWLKSAKAEDEISKGSLPSDLAGDSVAGKKEKDTDLKPQTTNPDGYNSIMEYVLGNEIEDTHGEKAEIQHTQTPVKPDEITTSQPSSQVQVPHPSPHGEKKDNGEPTGDPVVTALIRELDAAMSEASLAFESHDSEGVARATGRIIKESESVGLRLLARMASCVEMAAKEKDMNALSDLLPELALAVERNRLALNQNIRGNSHD